MPTARVWPAPAGWATWERRSIAAASTPKPNRVTIAHRRAARAAERVPALDNPATLYRRTVRCADAQALYRHALRRAGHERGAESASAGIGGQHLSELHRHQLDYPAAEAEAARPAAILDRAGGRYLLPGTCKRWAASGKRRAAWKEPACRCAGPAKSAARNCRPAARKLPPASPPWRAPSRP